MITPRFSSSDVAGVFGLLAFLNDPKACEDRLVELQVEADAAYKARSEAQALVNEAAEAKETIAKANEESEQVKKNAAELMAQAKNASDEADAKQSAAAQREAAVSEAEAALKARAATLSQHEMAVAERDEQLIVAEESVAALKAEYAQKLETFRAIAA